MSVTLRDITKDDLEQIMKWRMDPDITRYMNTDPQLTLDSQKKWFEKINSDDSVKYWLIIQDEKPIGVINLLEIDWGQKTSSWGYYVGEKEQRSLKLAISLEMSLYDYVFDVLGFDELHNEVFSLNAGVVKLHLACGSHITNVVEGEIVKNGIAYDITHISITKEKWESIRESKKYEHIYFDNLLKPHHIGYAVSDINKAIKEFRYLGYYQDGPIIQDESRNVIIAFMKNYDEHAGVIELVAPDGEKNPVSVFLANNKAMSGPYHICYVTSDLCKTISFLKRRGFMPITAIAPAIAINGRNVVFLINRDAGMIELVEGQI